MAFAQQTITFGTGAAEVNTLADLNTRLTAAATATGGAFTANANIVGNTGALTFSKTAGTKSSLSITGTVNSVNSNAVLLEGATEGTVFSTHNSAKTIADAGKTLGAAAGGPFTISAPTLTINVNGTDTTVTLAATDRIDDVINKLSANATLGAKLNFTKTNDANGDHIKIDFDR